MFEPRIFRPMPSDHDDERVKLSDRDKETKDMPVAGDPRSDVSEFSASGGAAIAELEIERKELIARLAVVESTLRQREEEIEQTRSDLLHISTRLEDQEVRASNRQAELEMARESLGIIKGKLQEANDWVFKLAGERQSAQVETTSLRRQLDVSEVERLRFERAVIQHEQELTAIRTERADLLAELANLSRQLELAHHDQQKAEQVNNDLRQFHSDHVNNLQRDHASSFTSLMTRLGDAHDRLEISEERVFEQTRELSLLTNLLCEREEALGNAEAEKVSLAEQSIAQTCDLEMTAKQLQEAKDACDRVEKENDALLRAHATQIVSLEQEHDRALSEAMERLKDANHKYQDFESRIGEQTRELASLSILLIEAEANRNYKTDVLDWSVQLYAETRNLPVWWRLMPSAWQARRLNARLLACGLFDAQAYLSLYPDVAAVSADPLRHFLSHGMREGRTLTR